MAPPPPPRPWPQPTEFTDVQGGDGPISSLQMPTGPAYDFRALAHALAVAAGDASTRPGTLGGVGVHESRERAGEATLIGPVWLVRVIDRARRAKHAPASPPTGGSCREWPPNPSKRSLPQEPRTLPSKPAPSSSKPPSEPAGSNAPSYDSNPPSNPLLLEAPLGSSPPSSTPAPDSSWDAALPRVLALLDPAQGPGAPMLEATWRLGGLLALLQLVDRSLHERPATSNPTEPRVRPSMRRRGPHFTCAATARQWVRDRPSGLVVAGKVWTACRRSRPLGRTVPAERPEDVTCPACLDALAKDSLARLRS